MTRTPQQALGKWGEDLAINFLIQRGYKIVARNLRTPYGEIDLVVQDEDELVFVEVKTRATNAYGPPEAAITYQKREHMIASAQSYLQTSRNAETNWRIDVIAIRKLKSSKKPEIIHFENALS